jgi:hypothetical protein
MWSLRSRQYLLANGIAVMQVNPQSGDYWEWYSEAVWDAG